MCVHVCVCVHVCMYVMIMNGLFYIAQLHQCTMHVSACMCLYIDVCYWLATYICAMYMYMYKIISISITLV